MLFKFATGSPFNEQNFPIIKKSLKSCHIAPSKEEKSAVCISTKTSSLNDFGMVLRLGKAWLVTSYSKNTNSVKKGRSNTWKLTNSKTPIYLQCLIGVTSLIFTCKYNFTKAKSFDIKSIEQSLMLYICSSLRLQQLTSIDISVKVHNL